MQMLFLLYIYNLAIVFHKRSLWLSQVLKDGEKSIIYS